jgi:two-component system OmpR family sensor kinase
LLARLDQGRSLEHDEVDLPRVVEQAVAAIRVVDDRRTYHLDAETSAAIVVGDAVAMRQIVDNLLRNVSVHTPPLSSAWITVTRGPERTSLAVEDDGPGMTPEQQVCAFDRFWRAESSRVRPGGSGLGLAIVADLVRAQGGTIELHSAPGHGSRFVVAFPNAGNRLLE